MRFEFSHEFDAPLDALELAIMSPDLAGMLARHWSAIESVKTVSHNLQIDVFERVWRFQARAPLKLLQGYEVTREMLAWHEHVSYRRGDHSGAWRIVPCDPSGRAKNYFAASGSYQLDPLEDGRTRRTVIGELKIRVKVVGKVLERVALAEVRKAYDAEADALRALCSLV